MHYTEVHVEQELHTHTYPHAYLSGPSMTSSALPHIILLLVQKVFIYIPDIRISMYAA